MNRTSRESSSGINQGYPADKNGRGIPLAKLFRPIQVFPLFLGGQNLINENGAEHGNLRFRRLESGCEVSKRCTSEFIERDMAM